MRGIIFLPGKYSILGKVLEIGCIILKDNLQIIVERNKFPNGVSTNPDECKGVGQSLALSEVYDNQ